MPYDSLPSFTDYANTQIPFYGSYMKFARTTMFTRMNADPNGCVYSFPKNWDGGTDYWQPGFYTCSSAETLSIQEDDHYLIRKPLRKGMININTEYQYYLFTASEVYRLDNKGRVIEVIEHNIGTPPISRLGGVLKGTEEPYYYHSFLSGALPHWNKMVRQVSDRDGSIVNYLHGQTWRLVSNSEANTDMGFADGNGQKKASKQSSPFTEIEVFESALTDKNATIPPYGVVQKDVAIFQELDKMVDKEREEAFDALILTIVNEAGASQSGIAKAHDRQDVNSMYQVVSDHTFRHISRLLEWAARWRYGSILGDRIEEILPNVSPPQNFEALTMKELTQELNESSMLPKAYKRELMNRVTALRFNSSETERERLKTILQFDTLATDSIEDILAARQEGVVTKANWYYHEHSEEIIDMLMEENPDFLSLTYTEKKEAIDQKVKEELAKIKESDLDVDILIDANT
jgi:hypothetical protein